MSVKIGSLFGDISIRTAQLDKDIASIGRKMRKMGTDMQAMGKTLSRNVTAPIVAIGTAAVVSFAQLEKGMNEVKSLMPDIDGGEFEKLQRDVRALSVELGVNAVDQTKALYQAISAGVPRENAIEFLRVSTMAAIAGVTQTTVAVDGLTTVLNAYRMEADQTERVADILFTGVRLGKTTFEELSASMFQVAPLASAMNIPLEEVVAAVTSLTKQGVPTNVAMNQIRRAMIALQRPTAAMEGAFASLGVATGQALLDQRGLQGALQALRMEAGLSDTELARAVGSVEALGAVLALTGDNFQGAVQDLRDVVESSGAMTRAFEDNNEGVGRSFAKALAIIREVGYQIGEQLAPIVTDIAEKFRDWYETNKASIPGWVELGVKIGAVAAAVGPLLIALGTLVKLLASATAWKISLGVAVFTLIERTGVLRDLGYALGDMFTAVFSGSIIGAIRAADRVLYEFANLFPPLGMAIRGFDGLVRGVFGFLVNQIQSAVEGMRMLIQLMGQLNPLRGVGESIGDFISDIAFRADGGPVAAGSPYIVGERGPEMFIPRYSGTIVPNESMGGGGQHITMNFAAGIGMDVVSAIKNNRGLFARIAVDAVREDARRRA